MWRRRPFFKGSCLAERAQQLADHVHQRSLLEHRIAVGLSPKLLNNHRLAQGLRICERAEKGRRYEQGIAGGTS